MMHQQFFKLISQNPEYVKTPCIDKNNAFLPAIRKRMINQ